MVDAMQEMPGWAGQCQGCVKRRNRRFPLEGQADEVECRGSDEKNSSELRSRWLENRISPAFEDDQLAE